MSWVCRVQAVSHLVSLAAESERQAKTLTVTGNDIDTEFAGSLEQAQSYGLCNSRNHASAHFMGPFRQRGKIFDHTEIVRITGNHSRRCIVQLGRQVLEVSPAIVCDSNIDQFKTEIKAIGRYG